VELLIFSNTVKNLDTKPRRFLTRALVRDTGTGLEQGPHVLKRKRLIIITMLAILSQTWAYAEVKAATSPERSFVTDYFQAKYMLVKDQVFDKSLGVGGPSHIIGAYGYEVLRERFYPYNGPDTQWKVAPLLDGQLMNPMAQAGAEGAVAFCIGLEKSDQHQFCATGKARLTAGLGQAELGTGFSGGYRLKVSDSTYKAVNYVSVEGYAENKTLTNLDSGQSASQAGISITIR